jgi:hypothetical protein
MAVAAEPEHPRRTPMIPLRRSGYDRDPRLRARFYGAATV